jgi:glutamate N-acetyltransferase/amino-acid N-acetyltransferase
MIKGIKIATINCGIKYKNRDDLLLVTFDDAANVAGVFTQSSMPAAPVVWCKNNIKNGHAKALIVNAGNANAFTGKAGEDAVLLTAQTIAKNINCSTNEIFISSTGVIGETLKVELITDAIPNLVKNPITDESPWEAASKAIMTTDLKPKMVKKTCEIDGKKISLIGFAKGSGMIAPNMATMLAYIFTDANIESSKLSELLKSSTEKSFNSITVDSDQSTNDTLLIFATKTADNLANADLSAFKNTLDEVCLELAKMIVVDGEGAKKLIEIEVAGASNHSQAKTVAFAIANSPLVKTAIAGCDPNWGRIVMAVGKSCFETSPEKIVVKIGEFQLTKDGAKHPDYVEKNVHEYLKNSEVKIFVDLGIKAVDANNGATVWTCDLNEEYIKINKDYRS